MVEFRGWFTAGAVSLALACGDDGGNSAMDTGSGSSDTGSGGPSTTGSGSATASSGSASGATTQSSTSESGGSDTGDPIDFDALSDDFEGGQLLGWEQFQPSAARLDIAGGQLLFEPSDDSLWFNDRAGALLYKSVPGNFMVTAQVTARSLSNPSAPPEPQYRLGGLMARDGDSASENYVFIVVGADGNDVSVETKTTRNSQSQFSGPPWPDASGELRICRIGSQFQLLIREPGGSWQVQDTFDRPDLPGTVQVGPVAYANNTPADLRVTYDSVDFAAAQTMADCDR